MACTIDHLRPDYGMRVLRDFTDARCGTEAELIALENELLGRTRESDFPTEKPPVDLPQSMRAFAEFWSALQLTPEMLTALKALQRKLVRHDADLVSAITLVLRELLGEPPPTHRGPYLP